MIKRKILAIILGMMVFGIASCAQAEPDTTDADVEQDVGIEGPAFVLFFTDP